MQGGCSIAQTIGERDGNMPQKRPAAPAHREPALSLSKGPSATSDPNRSPTSFESGGLSLFSLTVSIKIGTAPAVYRSVGLAPGLGQLIPLPSHISTGTARSEGASGR
jgi:hypothetical protein